MASSFVVCWLGRSLITRDANHFELYFDEHFDSITHKTAKFFTEHFLHLLDTAAHHHYHHQGQQQQQQ